jgi:Flp pilus assembly protein TadD
MLLERRSDPASYARALELAKRFRERTEPALVDTLGWAFYRNGDFLSAIPYLQIAVEGADDVPQTHYHLGMAYFAAKDLSSARHELEKAIRLAGGDFPEIDEAQKALDSIEEKTAAR